MVNRRPWHEISTTLVDVAMGRAPADLVVRGGRWVNVNSGEIVDDIDVAVVASRIAYCGPDAGHCIGSKTQLIEADGRYLVPGLLDAHTHTEVAMITATEYTRAVIPHGTTGMFVDPHEIVNVFGLRGLRAMLDEVASLPISIYVQMPSSVPSVPQLETAGATIGPSEVAEAMGWPGIIGLAEVVNFPGVAASDPNLHASIAATMQAGKVVGGHYASLDFDPALHGYIAGGPADDHEGTREIDAIERVRRGMRPALRLGTTWYDVEAQLTAITEKGLDSRHFLLCTDGMLPETLLHEGHMNRVVRHAIGLGLDPIKAVQMATLNTAEHFGLDRDIGSVAPGRYADILIASDLETLEVDTVVCAGVVLAENGKLIQDIPAFEYPHDMRQSVNITRRLKDEDFIPAAPEDVNGRVKAHVIRVTEASATTQHRVLDLPTKDGKVLTDSSNDVAYVAIVERHHGTGAIARGFVQGFNLAGNCAAASTISHDSHHLVVIGTSAQDMALAANKLTEIGGGLVVYQDGAMLALVELPIAGIMSDASTSDVAEKLTHLEDAYAKCGCHLSYAYKQLSMLALVSIPQLRISDLGIVDVERSAIIEPLDR